MLPQDVVEAVDVATEATTVHQTPWGSIIMIVAMLAIGYLVYRAITRFSGGCRNGRRC